jgi:hypothetical protein
MSNNFFKGCPALMSDARFLTDYRTPTTREQYNKYINGIVRDDDYRMFLQQNGTKIMDDEWAKDKKNNSCFPNECIHMFPTRSTPGMMYDEMNLYNATRRGKLAKPLPVCSTQPDYRASQTTQTVW